MQFEKKLLDGCFTLEDSLPLIKIIQAVQKMKGNLSSKNIDICNELKNEGCDHHK